MYGMASGGNMRMASMGGGYGNQSQWGYGVSEGADLFGSGPPQKRARENDDIGGRPPLSVLNEVYPNLDYKITETKAGTVPFFLANVQVDNKVYEGCGKSKKLAKNDAAQKVLEHLDKTGKLSNKSAIRAEALQKNPPKSKALSEMNIEELVNEIEVDPKLNSDVNAIKTLAKQCNMGPIMVLSKMKPNTVFQFASESGEPHDKTYSFTCTVDNKTFEGIACSKKLAKTAAARLALQKVCGVKLPDGPDKNNSQTMEIEGQKLRIKRPTQASNAPQSSNKRKNQGNWSGPRGGESVATRLYEVEGPTYEIPESHLNKDRKFANNCRLWIGNMPKGTTEDEIKQWFNPYGEYTDFYFDEVKFFAFITLDYRENAVKAKEALHGKKIKNANLIVKYSAPGCALRVRNLSPWVTNELLEYSFRIFGDLEKAVIICDDKGKPTGEGIVEFCKKPCAQMALKRCDQGLFFITFSPRPVIAEPLSIIYDGDGFKESDLKKHTQEFKRERLLGPRFATPGSFEENYGYKWKQVYDIFDMKKNMLEKELLLEEKQLLEEIEQSQYEYETNLLREQVRHREEALAFTNRSDGGYDQTSGGYGQNDGYASNSGGGYGQSLNYGQNGGYSNRGGGSQSQYSSNTGNMGYYSASSSTSNGGGMMGGNSQSMW